MLTPRSSGYPRFCPNFISALAMWSEDPFNCDILFYYVMVALKQNFSSRVVQNLNVLEVVTRGDKISWRRKRRRKNSCDKQHQRSHWQTVAKQSVTKCVTDPAAPTAKSHRMTFISLSLFSPCDMKSVMIGKHCISWNVRQKLMMTVFPFRSPPPAHPLHTCHALLKI